MYIYKCDKKCYFLDLDKDLDIFCDWYNEKLKIDITQNGIIWYWKSKKCQEDCWDLILRTAKDRFKGNIK